MGVVGAIVGDTDGSFVGDSLGASVGLSDGESVGLIVGDSVGVWEKNSLGLSVVSDGAEVISIVGSHDGSALSKDPNGSTSVGAAEGDSLGEVVGLELLMKYLRDGLLLGKRLGYVVGSEVGLTLGSIVGSALGSSEPAKASLS